MLECAVQILEAAARENALDGDATQLTAQRLKRGHFGIVARRKPYMAAFGRHPHGPLSVARETGDSESGPRTHDGDRSAGEPGDLRPDGAQILRLQNLGREREHGEIVHEERALKAKFEQLPLGDVPSPVREARRPVGYRTGHGDCRGPRTGIQSEPLEVAAKCLGERREVSGQVLAVMDPISVRRIDQREASVGAADVAYQDGVSQAQADLDDCRCSGDAGPLPAQRRASPRARTPARSRAART